ncbi:hypothetical protein BC826DRAFT_975338 [Russula brevipes]|nr:hypothetical protein BC826DRAFT_975338 [Russula brevipes]
MSQELLPWELCACHPTVHNAPTLGNLLVAPVDADRRQAMSWLLPPWEPACIVPAIVGEPIWWLLLRVPPQEPARIVPAVCDALCLGNLLAAPFNAGHALSMQTTGKVMPWLFPLGAPCHSVGFRRNFEYRDGVAEVAMVWDTEATVVVWAACSSGGGWRGGSDMESAVGVLRP